MFNQIPNYAKLFILILVINSVFVLAYKSFSQSGSTLKADIKNGEKLFKINCAGCHLNGQNLIEPKKPIVGSAKLKSKELFKGFLQSPPAPMPNFKNITSNSVQLDSLYSYVISLMGK